MKLAAIFQDLEHLYDFQQLAMVAILLHYNSLLCGTQCCSRMATRHHGQRLRKIYCWP